MPQIGLLDSELAEDVELVTLPVLPPLLQPISGLVRT